MSFTNEEVEKLKRLGHKHYLVKVEREPFGGFGEVELLVNKHDELEKYVGRLERAD